jgi:HNH endonuclease
MKASTRALVRSRAGRRCEYCRLHESDLPLLPFHIEHIIARKHGGTGAPDKLAWSCHYCNLAKSSNLSGLDPVSGRIAALFHPRRQRWKRHFRWDGPRLVGRTAGGRATIAVLNINAPHRVDLRDFLIRAGLFPPE